MLDKDPKKMASGVLARAFGAKTSTSTTGNKTKTGGSNPGGASTGGAGTVTISTGKIPPKGINISNVGGQTDARNPGGMDPSDEEEGVMMAEGGEVEGGGVEEGKLIAAEEMMSALESKDPQAFASSLASFVEQCYGSAEESEMEE